MPTLRAIERATAIEADIPIGTLRTERARPIARVRHLAWHIAREMTDASTTAIGRHWERDHTTVLFGIRRAAERLLVDVDLQDLRERIVRRLQDPAAAEPEPPPPPPPPPAAKPKPKPKPPPAPEPLPCPPPTHPWGEPVLDGGCGPLRRDQLAEQEERFATAMREALS